MDYIYMVGLVFVMYIAPLFVPILIAASICMKIQHTAFAKPIAIASTVALILILFNFDAFGRHMSPNFPILIIEGFLIVLASVLWAHIISKRRFAWKAALTIGACALFMVPFATVIVIGLMSRIM